MRKRVTSSDVAKLAGVSRSLVSAVLNGTPGITVSEENRAAVLHAIKELNYTVNVQARGIKTGKSHCIGVFGQVYNALFLQLIEGVQKESGPAGYHVLLYGEGMNVDDREGLIGLYRQGRIDGIISLDYPDALDAEWERLVLENQIPYVTVEGIPRSEQVLSVRTDYRKSVFQGLEQLCRSREAPPPLYLNIFTEGRPATAGDTERKEAYAEWMGAKGMMPVVVDVPDEAWAESESRWLEWLGRQTRPVAVFSNWSRGAVHLYRATYSLGWKIGSDLLVAAGDNTERLGQHMIPPLSCVEVPYMEMGEQAFRMLLERLDRNTDAPMIDTITTVPCKWLDGLSC